MKPEQAWNACISQLQMEMPKSAFDTWVRDARLIAYEDGVFSIGAQTEYARIWLKDRIGSTATRLLTGIMNRTVEVCFSVLEPVEPITPPYAETEQTSSQRPDDEQVIRIQAAHQSLRDYYVQPERVVMIPGYFKRWLPYLGPSLSWIVVAFRQAMYLATGKAARPRVEFRVSPTSVSRWAGINRSTLWRHLDDPQLGWFITRLPGETDRFVFQAGMPLTPGDGERLSCLLNEAGIRENPLAALDRVLVVEPADLMPYPPPQPKPEHLNQLPAPLGVQDLVLKLCGKLDKSSLKQVLEKADQLALRVAPPADRIYVSHYFLLNWLPRLGAAPAWFVTLMRDRCYISRDEMRDDVWIWGGYPEIASMLGISRPKTVGEWLSPAFQAPTRPPQNGCTGEQAERQRRRDAKRNLLDQFIQRQQYQEFPGFLAWRFKINLVEPLIPEHQSEYDQMLDLVGEYLETGDRSIIDELLSEQDEGAIATHEGAFATFGGAIATSSSGTKARLQQVEARLQHDEGANATAGRRDCNALNTLKHLLNHLNHLDCLTTSTTQAAGAEPRLDPAAKVVVGSSWDLNQLLAQNQTISTKARQALLEQRPSPQALVSWLLYAASASGTSIRQPALFAVSHLRQEPQKGAGDAFDRLSRLPPAQLYALIASALENPYLPPPYPDWQQAMSGASATSLQTLRRQLFGENPND